MEGKHVIRDWEQNVFLFPFHRVKIEVNLY